MGTTLSVGTKGLWQDYVSFEESDSIRTKLVALLGQKLAEIQVANGYRSDLGLNVFLHRPTNLAEAELPGIIYRDVGNERMEEGMIGAFRWRLLIELSVKAASAALSAAKARELIEDVYKAISTNNTWNGFASWTEQPSDELQIDQNDKTIAGVTINFAVVYDAPLWQI